MADGGKASGGIVDCRDTYSRGFNAELLDGCSEPLVLAVDESPQVDGTLSLFDGRGERDVVRAYMIVGSNSIDAGYFSNNVFFICYMAS